MLTLQITESHHCAPGHRLKTASFKHKSTSHPLTFVTNSDTAETLGTVMATLCIFSEKKGLFPNIYGVIHPGIFDSAFATKFRTMGPISAGLQVF